MKAAQVTRFGEPGVLALTDLPDPAPGPGQVAIDVTHAAVGLIDAYIRQGLYKDRDGLPQPPYVPGLEVAGTVRALGEGVTGFAPGEKVVARRATRRSRTSVLSPPRPFPQPGAPPLDPGPRSPEPGARGPGGPGARSPSPHPGARTPEPGAEPHHAGEPHIDAAGRGGRGATRRRRQDPPGAAHPSRNQGLRPVPRGLGQSPSCRKGRGGEQPAAGATIRRAGPRDCLQL